MTTPFLGGLGAALQSLGQTSTQNSYLKSLQDEQAKRDALQQLATMNTIGARPLQPGEDPDQAIQNIVNGNMYAQQVSGHGAIPQTAIGGTQKPYMGFGQPYATTVGGQQLIVDPGQSAQALSEKRYLAAQADADQRADARIQGQQAVEQQRADAAAALAKQKAEQDAPGDFAFLQSMVKAGSASPVSKDLVAKGYDVNNAGAYAKAADFEKSVYIQAHAYHAPPMVFSPTTVQGPNGPETASFSRTTGATTPTGQQAVPKAGAAGGAREQAQIQVAHNQATTADSDMTATEKAVASGQLQFTPADFYAARKAWNGSVGGSTIAETLVQNMNPALVRYLRGAKAMSVAERLITPRGGSNQMTSAEQVLSAIGGGQNNPQELAKNIAQVQAYRRALVQGLASAVGTQGAPQQNSPPTGAFIDLLPKKPED